MSEFVSYLNEVFSEFGDLTTRKMFGGWGIYHQGLMFGLVADDELYLKCDAQNHSEFDAAGSEAFSYDKNGKEYKMSYFKAPEEIFDDPERARHWASIAFEAALRTASKKRGKKSN